MIRQIACAFPSWEGQGVGQTPFENTHPCHLYAMARCSRLTKLVDSATNSSVADAICSVACET